MSKQRLEAKVQIADLGVQAYHGDDSAQIQVVAVVFQSESVATLHLGDEFAPALDQTFAAGTNDVLRIAVFTEIGGHFLVSHTVLLVAPLGLSPKIAFTIVGDEECSDG